MGIVKKILKAIKKSNYVYITEFKDGKAKAITCMSHYYYDQPLAHYMIYIANVPYYAKQSIHIIDENYDFISDTGLYCTYPFWGEKFDAIGVLLVQDDKRSYLLNKNLDVIYEFEQDEIVKYVKGTKLYSYSTTKNETRIYQIERGNITFIGKEDGKSDEFASNY